MLDALEELAKNEEQVIQARLKENLGQQDLKTVN